MRRSMVFNMWVVHAAATAVFFLGTCWGFQSPPTPHGHWLSSRPLRTTKACRPTAAGAASLRMSLGGDDLGGDVLVVGGGLAGLSVALEVTRRGGRVTVLCRDPEESASMAAGGMLAPQAERLNEGPYLDVCLQSRSMYPEWVSQLESLAGPGYTTGLSTAGGFLTPIFPGDKADDWQPPQGAGAAHWLSPSQIRNMEPSIARDVKGGWWFPDDMQVDARSTYRTLRAACRAAKVKLIEGEAAEVEALIPHPVDRAIKGVRLKGGRCLEYPKVVLANGAWMQKLLPLPIYPVKGQMLSVRVPPGTNPLSRVLFCDGCYIIPKLDGRIVVGATVEEGVYDRQITIEGLHHLTSRFQRICPDLASFPIEETWTGLRPTTPDQFPVLGKTPWSNLFVAAGYWRNGVLLAPRTASLVADAIEGSTDQEGNRLLNAFSWERFLPQGEGSAPRGLQRPAAYTPPPAVRHQAPPPPPAAFTPPPPQAISHQFTPIPDQVTHQPTHGHHHHQHQHQTGYPTSAGAQGQQDEEWEDLGDMSPRAMGWESDPYAEDYLEDTTRKPIVKNQQQPPPPAPTPPPASSSSSTPSVGEDSYADLIKLRQASDEDLILLESRRQNREEIVQYGLEEDPVGYGVAAKWNVPSSGVNQEWEGFDRMAEEGLQAADRVNLGPDFQRKRRQPPAPEAPGTITVVGELDPETKALYDLFRSRGYEMKDPKAARKAERRERIREYQAKQGSGEVVVPAIPPEDAPTKPLQPPTSSHNQPSPANTQPPTIQEVFASYGYAINDPKEKRRQEKRRKQQQQQQPPQPQQPPPPPQRQTRPDTFTEAFAYPPKPAEPAPVFTPPSPVSNAAPATIPHQSAFRPPWADEMDKLYAQVIKKQHEAKKRQLGEKVYRQEVLKPDQPLELLDLPFSEKKYTQEEVDMMTPEQLFQVLEVVRVNPDGTYTKVEFGEGWPKPWKPSTPSSSSSSSS